MAVEITNFPLIDSQNKAIGLQFPLGKGNNGYFQSTYSTVDAIKQNLKNLILTEKGERLQSPDFGTSLRQFIFEPYVEGDFETKIENEVISSINKWMPYINIEQIYFDITDTNKDKHLVELELKFSINFASSQINESLTIAI